MYWDPTDKTAMETSLISRYEEELDYEIKWAGSKTKLAKTFKKYVRYHDNALFAACYTRNINPTVRVSCTDVTTM